MSPGRSRAAPLLAALVSLCVHGACAPAPLREDHEVLGLGMGVLVMEDVEFTDTIPGVNDSDDISVIGGGFSIDRYLGKRWTLGGGIDYRSYRPTDRSFPDAEAAELVFRVRRVFWTERVLQPFIGLRVFTALEWHMEDGSDTSPYVGIAPALGFTYWESPVSSMEVVVSWVRTLEAPAVEGTLGAALGESGRELNFEGPELTWWVNYWF